MFSVIVVKRFDDDPIPSNANQLPPRGKVLGNAADFMGDESVRSLSYEKAIIFARGYNDTELSRPHGTWAIVVGTEQQVEPGTLVNLQSAADLN